MKRIRVLLADDHPLTLEGLRVFLEPHHDVIGTVNDGRSLVDAAVHLRPDLVILDITMPLLNGIDAAAQIRKSLPAVKMLFVTMHANPTYVEAALTSGASGYVLKSAAREELLDAIKAVVDGRIYVTNSLANENLNARKDLAGAAASFHLSFREREILQLVAEGRAAKEIGFVLGISVKTVAFHRENIKKKLSLKSTAELTRYAIEQGLL